jgi:hypothetical protein
LVKRSLPVHQLALDISSRLARPGHVVGTRARILEQHKLFGRRASRQLTNEFPQTPLQGNQMDTLSVLGGTTEAVNGGAQQAQPEQPQLQQPAQPMAPGVAPSQSFENPRPKSMWYSILTGALQGLASSGGSTSFGAGLGRGAAGKMAYDRQATFDEQEIRFRDAQAARMTADASMLNLQITQMPEELKLKVHEQQLRVAGFLSQQGLHPTMVVEDSPEAAKAAMVQFTKVHGSVPGVQVLHIGDKLAIYAPASAEEGDASSRDYVNKVRRLQGLPNVSDGIWSDPKQREATIHDSHSLFFPQNVTKENAETEYQRRKLIADNYARTSQDPPEQKQEMVSLLRGAAQMIRDVQQGNLQRELTVERAKASVRHENSAPSMKDSNTLRDDYNKDLSNIQWPVIQATMAKIQVSSKDHSPAGDLSLIFSYMRLLDPSSAVREQEFRNAETAAPLLQKYGLEKYARVWRGERLTPDQRADFVARAKEIYSEIKTQKSELDSLYRGRAKRWGVNVEDVLSPDLSVGSEQQNGFTVTDPRGVVHNFKSQADADNFKKEAGIQ